MEKKQTDTTVAHALRSTLISPNESDINYEAANVVDGLFAVSRSVRGVALAIFPDALPAADPTGGHVASLSEAVMGITNGLVRVADALQQIAQAINDHDPAGSSHRQ